MIVFSFKFFELTRLTKLNNLQKQHVICCIRFFFPFFILEQGTEVRELLGGGLGKGFIFHIIEERTRRLVSHATSYPHPPITFATHPRHDN